MDSTPIIVKKKKVHAEHGHHGGSWKVAYADFVTAMMAFFMVMWIMGLSEATRTQIQGYFNDPLGFMKSMPRSRDVITLPSSVQPRPGKNLQDSSRQGQASDPAATQKEKEQEEAKDIKLAIKEAIEKEIAEGDTDLKELLKYVEATITDEGLKIELVDATGAVFFESGQAAIRPAARRLVAAIAPIINRSNRRIIIEGHTDAVPYPGDAYDNWDLSSDRANSLRRALMEDGISYRRFLELRPLAETELKFPDRPSHFANRRVVLILPFRRLPNAPFPLPREVLREEIQGVFKRPVEVAPPKPRIAGP